MKTTHVDTLPEHLRARRTVMRRQWSVQVVALSVALVAFIGAGRLISPINEIRKDRQLIIDPSEVKGLPPDIALLGKLGTFRALAIQWASHRADRLKEQGKTYEALDLHLTICRLTPRFPTVWTNAAWNMAYNISVMKYTPEERWQWVQNGIKLLRDEGLEYNPKSVRIYKEIAWIYWHKIGDFLDDEHLNYKKALAVQMETVLGAPPIVLTEQEYLDWFSEIVAAPRKLDRLIETDPNIARLVAHLHRFELEPDVSLLAFVARYDRPGLQVSDVLLDTGELDEKLHDRLRVIKDPENRETLGRLLAAVRSAELRDVWKFDLDWMLHLMVDEYGPLDWRNAFSHSLYWASYGDKHTRNRAGANPADVLFAARFVFFSMQNMITRGRVSLTPNFDRPFDSYYELTPDTRFIPFLYNTYMRLTKEHFSDRPDYVEGMPSRTFRTGFVSNMQNWVELLFLEGGEKNVKQAERYLAWLRDYNPHPDGTTQSQYTLTVEEYVMGNIVSQLQTYKAAGGFIRSLVRRALKSLALGQMPEWMKGLRLARKCYDYWQVDTRIDMNERRMMQPFLVILRDETRAYMQSTGNNAFYKMRLWRSLSQGRLSQEGGLSLRQMIYDDMQPYFERLCAAQQPPWDEALAFPEPPGMEAFRKTEIEYRGEAKDLGGRGTRFRD